MFIHVVEVHYALVPFFHFNFFEERTEIVLQVPQQYVIKEKFTVYEYEIYI